MPLEQEDKEYIKTLFAEISTVVKTQADMIESLRVEVEAQKVKESSIKEDVKEGKEDPVWTSRFQELQKQLDQEVHKRKTLEEQSKQQKLLALVQERLVTAGVPVKTLPHVLGYLADTKRAFSYHNEEPVMKVRGEYNDTLLPLEQGIDKWLKSEEAAIYLPPKQVNGTGEVRNIQKGEDDDIHQKLIAYAEKLKAKAQF